MKNFKIGPLLLLLFLTAIPRNNYANPTSGRESSADNLVAEEVENIITSTANSTMVLESANNFIDEAIGHINSLYKVMDVEIPNSLKTLTSNIASILKSPVAKGMVVIADHLTKVVKYLGGKIRNTNYDEAIRQLEEEVGKLPSDLDNDRNNMLLRLYNANTRIVTTRVNLEQAAHQLQSFCQELIDIYEDNIPSMEVLNYTAKKFNKYANFVMGLLKEALEDYKEVQYELNEAKTSLKSFHYKLDKYEKKIESGRKKRDIGVRNKRDLGTSAIIGIAAAAIAGTAALVGGGIAIGYSMNRAEYNDKKYRIDKVQEILDKLFNENDIIQNYVSQEIVLISKWKTKLEASLLDNHHELSQEDIAFNIKAIKGRLIALKYACIAYLNNEIPAILQHSEQITYSPSIFVENKTAVPPIEKFDQTTYSPDHFIENLSATPRIDKFVETTYSPSHYIDNLLAQPHTETLSMENIN